MQTRYIVIIQGHPDASESRLCRALAAAYAQGAQEAGFEVTLVDVASLEFPWLHSKQDFENGVVPDTLQPCQAAIERADHLLIVFPLWLGTMPALLKAFFEQIFRPRFAFSTDSGAIGAGKLRGKSARVVVTMGMPAVVFRWYFGAHGVKSLTCSILRFSGIAPVREDLIGMVENANERTRKGWLERMRRLGRAGC